MGSGSNSPAGDLSFLVSAERDGGTPRSFVCVGLKNTSSTEDCSCDEQVEQETPNLPIFPHCMNKASK